MTFSVNSSGFRQYLGEFATRYKFDEHTRIFGFRYGFICDIPRQLKILFSEIWHSPAPFAAWQSLALRCLRHRMKVTDALLFILDQYSTAEADEILSKKQLGAIQRTLNPNHFKDLVADKFHFHATCVARHLPVPKVLAVIDYGENNHCDNEIEIRRVANANELENFLESLPRGTNIAIKKIKGSYGRGLLSMTVNGQICTDPNGQVWSSHNILEHCHSYKEGFLIQPWLEPHPDLRVFMPGKGFGTVRLVTFLIGTDVHIPYAFFKIPVGTNITDRFESGNSGNLLVAVEVASGVLGKAYGRTTTASRRLNTYECVPSTGYAIQGFQLPCWSAVLDAVNRGAMAFPELTTLGWDVAITQDGVYLLEANHAWDPAVQITLGRGIRRDMMRFVEEFNAMRRKSTHESR